MESLREKVDFKLITLASLFVVSSSLFGFYLEKIFALGFVLDIALWMRFLPLILLFTLTGSFLVILSVVSTPLARILSFLGATAGFSVFFFLDPSPIGIPVPFAFLIPLIYAASLAVVDYYARRSVRVFSIFSSNMFYSVFVKLFFFFVVLVGILVYFSAQTPQTDQLQIPAEVLDPALDLITERVISQVQSELGTGQFTQEEFLNELKKSGLLEALEEQYDIDLDESEISSSEELTQGLRQSLRSQLTSEVQALVEEYLEPYLPFLPLIAAVGVAFSLFFLSPVLSFASVGVFALLYRALIFAGIIKFEKEAREVLVLKLS